MKYLLAAALAAFVSPAAALPIVSGDGNETCNGAACVTVQPHPAWQTPGVGQWISYADTGMGGFVAPSSAAPPAPITQAMRDVLKAAHETKGKCI